MEHKIRILSDIKGYVTAVVDVNGAEYIVELHTIKLPTVERNTRIRQLAQDQAERNNKPSKQKALK